MEFNALMLLASCLILLSALLSRASNNLGVPTILLFLAVGVVASSGGVQFSNLEFAQNAGIVALLIILFSGGLDTHWKIVRPVFWHSLSLATVGVVITAGLVGVFVHYVLGRDWHESLLLGSIIASTDAAALFTLMRTRGIALKGRLTPLLEFESGTNDPMAVFLTLTMIQLTRIDDISFIGIFQHFALEMILGAAIGLMGGKLMLMILNHLRSPVDGIYPVVALSGAFLVYGFAAVLGASGFLAVYLAGLILGSNEFIHRKSVMRFVDGAAWLCQIGMFVLLGFLVNPGSLMEYAGLGIALVLFLALVARPVAVEFSLIGGGYTRRERTLVSWLGVRGAVPIILALFPLIAAVPNAQEISNLVFFIVIGSTLLQGWTIAPVARWLGLNDDRPKRALTEELPGLENSPMRLFDVVVPAGSSIIGKPIVEVSLPDNTLIVLITRGQEYVVPRGSTELQVGDKLQLLSEAGNEKKVYELVR